VLAIALERIANGRRGGLLLVTVVFAIGVPGNIRTLADRVHDAKALQQGTREAIEAAASSPQSVDAPGWVQPFPLAPWVTTQWLIDGVQSGRIARVSPPDRARSATIELAVSLQTMTQFTLPETHARIEALPGYRGLPTSEDCEPLRGWLPRTFSTGSAIGVRGSGQLWVYLRDGATVSKPVILGNYPYPQAAVVARGPLELLLVSVGSTVAACTT
jgi:hypothetical protein